MKKVLFLSAAIAAMFFSSCSNEEDDVSTKETKQLTIKIAGVVNTKAVEDKGKTDAGTIVLENGHIFVINQAGAVVHSEGLDVIDAVGNGQLLSERVPSDSRVYIICNIPAVDEVRITGLTTLSAINAATSLILTQVDYTKAALANASGEPTLITVNQADVTEASVNVTIKPLISRIELVQLVGTGTITAFNVEGVYLDDDYPEFTYIGGYGGNVYNQNQGTVSFGTGDAGPWTATGTAPSVTAIPAVDKVWAHNVASGGLPRFIIALSGVIYKDSNGNDVDLTGTTYYLTVTGYTSVSVFERGKIYRIGGDSGIPFDINDLALTPNPLDVDLTVKVTILEWEIVVTDAIL